MNPCNYCYRDGLLFIRDLDSGNDYLVLACTCALGQKWRVKWQLRAFVANLLPPPVAFGRLEDYFTPEELATFQPWTRRHMRDEGGREVVWR